MPVLPRFSLGTVQPDAELCPVLWGLLDTLERSGWHVQSFQSAASLSPVCGVRSITGQSQRHLDSWMMSRATCREVFENGSRAADVSVVSGRYDVARCPAQRSSLDTVAQWLDLPQLAVLDVANIDGCKLPALPSGVAGLLLDRVRDTADGLRWQTNIEALYGVPVLGSLSRAPKLRSLIEARGTGSPCRELCGALGELLEPTLRLERLQQIVQGEAWSPTQPRIFAKQPTDDPVKIAVAFDEAFQGYFADTLDALEAKGASICDFSPLRNESLPLDTDIVYLAGARIEPYVEALAQNICMRQALRNFVHRGGRVYAEGAGLAYLCERMVGTDGRQYPMTGLLPAIALARQATHRPRPVELTFGSQVWLGQRGTKLRGYVDDSWEVLPEGELTYFAEEEERRYDFIGDDRVIASRLQVDFAGQPHLLASFFRPRLGALLEV